MNAEQLARLAEAGSDLDADGQRALADMARLRTAEAEWRADRLAVIATAAELLRANRLQIRHVLMALGISQTTWQRRMAELRTWLEGRGETAATAAGDQAAAKHATNWAEQAENYDWTIL